jgi:septal ring factor EnvC (AmiA/AmiB activator)
MTDESRILDIRNDLASLRLIFSESHTSQQALLRELGGILNAVSSALSASHQIASSDREHLISRLESIGQLLSQDRRDGSETSRRMEAVLASLERDVRDIMTDRQTDRDKLGEIHRGSDSMAGDITQVLDAVDTINPKIEESLNILRYLAGKDSKTGEPLQLIESILRALQRAFWVAVATAAMLCIADALLPWVRGLNHSAPRAEGRP